jgi:thiaminase/transcriptional activator TenA
MAAESEAPETVNYTRYVLDIGHRRCAGSAGGADALRGWLCGNRPRPAAHPATRLTDNPYASWIRNYGDEGYLTASRRPSACWKASGSSAGARRASLS